jgi:hypothetical protein
MIPEHVTVEVLELGLKLEEQDSLPEIEYSRDFVYTLRFTAKTKLADSSGSDGETGSGTGGGSGGSTPPASAPEIIVDATNIGFQSPFDGVVIESLGSNLLRLKGTYLLAFGDYYRFVRKNGEQVILPPNTEEKDIALIQYKMPSQTTRTFQYNFNVSWPEGSSYEGTLIDTSVVVEQEAFWTTGAASANIDKLKNKGF